MLKFLERVLLRAGIITPLHAGHSQEDYDSKCPGCIEADVLRKSNDRWFNQQ